MNTRLIARYLAGECSDLEKENIKQWVQSDSNNEELMEEFRRVWKASGENNREFNDQFDPEEDWEELRRRIMRDRDRNGVDSSVPHLNTNYSKTKTRFTQFTRVAAIILVAALLGVLAYQNLYREPEVAEPVLREISMEKAQRGNVTLSDGTKVTLNAESKIILPNVFQNDKREITLEGEAFFHVSHNPDRPFIINIGDAVIQVLGTSLDVRSYPDDNSVQVVVEEGSVSLTSSKECVDDNALLSAGEMGELSITTDRITTKKVDDFDLFLGWTKGFLKFKEAPMSKVAEDLERKYDIEIKFEEQDLKDLRLTAELKSRTIQHNMDVISTSLDLDYSMDQQVITFYQREK